MPDLEPIRRAVARAIAMDQRLENPDDEEAPQADLDARQHLVSLLSERVGRPPWVVMLDGTVVAHTIEADGIAIISGGTVVAHTIEADGIAIISGDGTKLHLLGGD